MTKQETLKKVKGIIAEGITVCEPIHMRIEENFKYERGDQWSKADAERQEMRERPAVPWNSVFKVTNAICNREVVERLVPKVMGRERADYGIANVLDEACRWQRQSSFSEHFESIAFRSAGVGGYGCMHKFWNPVANNGDGMIQDEDVYIGEMLWPAKSRAGNLADRRWHVRGKWMDWDEAETLFGEGSRDLRVKIRNIKKSGSSPFTGAPEQDMAANPGIIAGTWQSVKAGSWVRGYTQEIFVAEAEWLETKLTYRAAVPKRMQEWIAFKNGTNFITIDTPDGPVQLGIMQYNSLDDQARAEIEFSIVDDVEILKYDSLKQMDEIKELYKLAFGKEFEDYHKTGREIVRFAVVIDDVIAAEGIRKWGWSYYFLTGFPFESSEGMEFFGVVDLIKGPQDYKNKLISSLVSMYMASPKGTLLVEKGAIPNMTEFTDRFASPSGVVEVPDGFIAGMRHHFAEAPRYPPIVDALLQLADKGVEEALGLSSIDIGSQGDLRRVSGTTVQAASTAHNVIVAHLYDSLRMFRKMYGMCNVRFITAQYRPQEIIRIVGEDKIEDIGVAPEIWEEIFKYDVVIDEQPTSPNELAEQMDYLSRTGTLERWEAEGKIAFEDVLDMLPYMPESLKRKILKNRDLMTQLQQCQTMLQALTQEVQGIQGGDQLISAAQQQAQGMLAQPAEGQPTTGE